MNRQIGYSVERNITHEEKTITRYIVTILPQNSMFAFLLSLVQYTMNVHLNVQITIQIVQHEPIQTKWYNLAHAKLTN